jgi:hypothetical protein
MAKQIGRQNGTHEVVPLGPINIAPSLPQAANGRFWQGFRCSLVPLFGRLPTHVPLQTGPSVSATRTSG